MRKRIFSSEAVCAGHPDKVADQIADAILDALLEKDPESRVACEVTCIPNQVHIFGEITSKAEVNYEQIARDTIRKIGYTKTGEDFDDQTCRIVVDLHEQSPDISVGIVRDKKDLEKNGAGDQGIMFGYAINQTDDFMPYSIEMANDLVKRLDFVRKEKILEYLKPDGKAQVSIECEGDIPCRIDTIVLSAQHDESVDISELRNDLKTIVIDEAIPSEWIDKKTRILINPTGRFVKGGPGADSGLTGRKLITDSYGGYARHGGGAISGKDPSKVDRSAAYMARYIAKNIVGQGYADECEVQLAYAIGVAEPVSIYIETFGTEHINRHRLERKVLSAIDCRPGAIIKKFSLKEPIYENLAVYGQFGENAKDMPWERIDLKL